MLEKSNIKFISLNDTNMNKKQNINNIINENINTFISMNYIALLSNLIIYKTHNENISTLDIIYKTYDKINKNQDDIVDTLLITGHFIVNDGQDKMTESQKKLYQIYFYNSKNLQ